MRKRCTCSCTSVFRTYLRPIAWNGPMSLTRGKQCRFCRHKWEREVVETQKEITELDVDRLQTFSPSQVAAIYYQDKFQAGHRFGNARHAGGSRETGTKSRGGIVHEITETDY